MLVTKGLHVQRFPFSLTYAQCLFLCFLLFLNSHTGLRESEVGEEFGNLLWVYCSRGNRLLRSPNPRSVCACFRQIHTSGNSGLLCRKLFAHSWGLNFFLSIHAGHKVMSVCQFSVMDPASTLCLSTSVQRYSTERQGGVG